MPYSHRSSAVKYGILSSVSFSCIALYLLQVQGFSLQKPAKAEVKGHTGLVPVALGIVVIDPVSSLLDLATRQTDMDFIQTDQEINQIDLHTTQTDLGIIQKDQDTTQTDLDIMQTDWDITQTDWDITRTDRDIMQTDRDTMQTDWDTMQTDRDIMQTDWDTMQTDLDTIQIDLDIAQTDLDIMQTDLDIMQTDLGRTQTDLGTRWGDMTDTEKTGEEMEEILTIVSSVETEITRGWICDPDKKDIHKAQICLVEDKIGPYKSQTLALSIIHIKMFKQEEIHSQSLVRNEDGQMPQDTTEEVMILSDQKWNFMTNQNPQHLLHF